MRVPISNIGILVVVLECSVAFSLHFSRAVQVVDTYRIRVQWLFLMGRVLKLIFRFEVIDVQVTVDAHQFGVLFCFDAQWYFTRSVRESRGGEVVEVAS